MNVTIPWLHQVIVRPTLIFMACETGNHWLASEDAQILMLGIAATESDLRHTRQAGHSGTEGPARSFWQVEPPTALDLLGRWRRGAMRAVIDPFLPPDAPVGSEKFREAMRYSQSLGCMLARLKILDAPPAIPSWLDVEAQAAYWKRFYNTDLGSGQPDDYSHAFGRHNVMIYAQAAFGVAIS